MKIVAILLVLKAIWAAVKLFFGSDSQKQEIKKLKAKLRTTRYEVKQEIDYIKSLPARKRDYTRYNKLLAKRKGLQDELKGL